MCSPCVIWIKFKAGSNAAEGSKYPSADRSVGIQIRPPLVGGTNLILFDFFSHRQNGQFLTEGRGEIPQKTTSEYYLTCRTATVELTLVCFHYSLNK